MGKVIDLNCDLGESFGVYKLGHDDEVVKIVSSVNIACGFHAGDPNVMDHTVAIAKENNVGIGAHPGFPDLRGFGRRNIDISRKDLINDIIYQMGALQAFCKKHGTFLQHVKPHGNMNNMADNNESMAEYIVEAIQLINPKLPIFVKTNSALHKTAKKNKLPFITEIFADRAYYNDMSLVSREKEGAVITDAVEAANRVIEMVRDNTITTITGEKINVKGDTICVHGDTPNALEMTRTISSRLKEIGIKIQSPITID